MAAVVRIDNAKEWEQLAEFALANGIKVEYTVPYTPMWNGVVERAFPHLRDQAYTRMLAS